MRKNKLNLPRVERRNLTSTAEKAFFLQIVQPMLSTPIIRFGLTGTFFCEEEKDISENSARLNL